MPVFDEELHGDLCFGSFCPHHTVLNNPPAPPACTPYLLAPKRSYRVPSYALSNQHLSEDALWRSCVMRCACSLPATMSVTGQTAHRRRGAAAWQALAKAHGAA